MLKEKFISIAQIFIICLVVMFLGGCGQTMDSFSETNDNLNWYGKYSLDSQEITIFIDDREYENDDYTIIQITDPEEIALLTNSVDFKNWHKAKPEEEYDGVNYYFIQFNDQTTICMYDNVAYGSIGRGVPGNIKDGDGYYNMPEGFLQAVQQLVAKHLE